MPKKKKGGKKKAKKAKVAAAPVLTEEEAQKAALVTEVQQLQLRLLREKQLEDRYYQERGRLQEFWELEKDKYRTLKREKATRQRELEDTEEVNGMEIKVWKRSMKHLIHEFQSETTELRRDLTVGLKAVEDENVATETLHRVDRRALEVERKKMEFGQIGLVTSLKQEQDQQITELREEFERRTREMQQRWQKKMQRARKALEDERKRAIQRIERRKDAQTQGEMAKHKEAFEAIQHFYSGITTDNLEQIKALKEEVAVLRKKEQQDRRKITEIRRHNQTRIEEPNRRAREDIERLRAEAAEYTNESRELQGTKKKLLHHEDELRSLDWEREVMQQRFEQVKDERDELEAEFQRCVFEVKQRAGFKNLLLERKMGAMDTVLEAKTAALNEVLTQANVEQFAPTSGRTDVVLGEKDARSRMLRAQLQALVARQNQMVDIYEEQMAAHAVPLEELGFEIVREPEDLHEMV